MKPFNTLFITIIKSTAILENICVLNLFTIFPQNTNYNYEVRGSPIKVSHKFIRIRRFQRKSQFCGSC